jgi:hypothetical protein
MELFGFTELRISTRGLRFAAVMASDAPAALHLAPILSAH